MYNIEKEPAYSLYKFTIFLYEKRKNPFFNDYDEQTIYRTITNRAYYSAYSMAESWLLNKHDKKIYDPNYYITLGEDIVSVHTQVRNHLKDLKMHKLASKMYSLKELRAKADYTLYPNLTEKDLSESIGLLEDVIKKFKEIN